MVDVQLNHHAHNATSVKYPLCFLANNIDVPMNIGSFFRIGDALGVEKIFITGTSTVPPNPKIKKTSRSTEKYVAYQYAENPVSIVEELKSKGYKIISLEITENSVDLADFKIENTDRICLILGSENHGIQSDLLEISDLAVHIPMLGNNSSMNVASACSIATYEITRQLRKQANSRE